MKRHLSTVITYLQDNPLFALIVLVSVLLLTPHNLYAQTNDVNPDTELDLAEQYLEEYEFEQVLDVLDNLVVTGHDAAEVKRLQGDASLKLGRLDDAVDYYKKSLEIVPDNYSVCMTLGEVLYSKSQWGESMEYFKRALEIMPDSISALNNVSSALMEIGDTEAAIEYLTRALEIDDSYADSYLNLGTVLIRSNEYVKAAEVLETAVKLDPSSSIAYNNLSLAYYKMGRYDESLKAIESSIELNPNDLKVLKNFAYLTSELEKIEPIEEPAGPEGDSETSVSYIEAIDIPEEGEKLDLRGKVYWEDGRDVEESVPAGWKDYVEVEEEPAAEPEEDLELVIVDRRGAEEDLEEDDIEQPVEEPRIYEAEESKESYEEVEPEAAPAEEEILSEGEEVEEDMEIPVIEEPASVPSDELMLEEPEKAREEIEIVKVPVEEAAEEKIPVETAAEMYVKGTSEKLDIVSDDEGLSPLPLPSGGISGEIIPYGHDLLAVSEYSMMELAELRKTIPGVFCFEDTNRMIWRYQPELSSFQKMFKGSSPECSPDGTGMIYVDWDINLIYLYYYNFPESTRTVLYATETPMKHIKFSPDGDAISFISVTSDFKEVLNVISIEDFSVRTVPEDMVFSSYTWNPHDGSIYIVVKDCPLENKTGALCYARWDTYSDYITYGLFDFKDAETQKPVAFVYLRKPIATFSPEGKYLLIYDGKKGASEFYVADIESKIVAKNRFIKPGKEEVQHFGNLAWGVDRSMKTFTDMGSIWVSVSEDIAPFPLVIGHFVDSRVSWCRAQ